MRNVPLISKKNRLKRFAYAKEHRHYPAIFWNKIMYIDEKKFELIVTGRRKYAWRRVNSAYGEGKIQLYTRSQSVMVW